MGRPNVYVPIAADVLERKLALIAEHFPSQAGRHWFDPEPPLARPAAWDGGGVGEPLRGGVLRAQARRRGVVTGEEMIELARELFPLPRSLTGTASARRLPRSGGGSR